MRRFPLVLFSVLLFHFQTAFAQDQIPTQEQDREQERETGFVSGVEETTAISREVSPERLFREVRVGARVDPKLGGVEGSLESQVRGPLLNIPLLNQTIRPEDAELKLGRFYLDLRSASASLLYSDNVKLSGNDPEDGLIGIMRLRLAAMFQVTEKLQLSVAGTLVYLPFRSEFGVAGFGIYDALAEFENETLARAQIAYDLDVGQWHTELFDEFRVRLGRFGESYELFDGETFDERDRAGRYVFRDRTPPPRRDSRLSDSFLETRNIVGFSTDRLLPTETRLEFGANHANYWYEGERGGFLPDSRDLGYVSLTSERESLRFKPFADYEAFRYASQPFNHEANIGFQGPVTENLELLAQVGYFNSGRADRDTYIWRVRVGHLINPRTFQRFGYTRRVTQPDQDIEQSWHYALRRNLANDVHGEIYVIKSRFDDLDNTRSGSDEWRVGTRVSFVNITRGTSLRLSGTYAHIDYDANIYTDRDRWTAQAEIHRGSLELRLLYHYQSGSTTPTRAGYDENLVGLTLIKYF